MIHRRSTRIVLSAALGLTVVLGSAACAAGDTGASGANTIKLGVVVDLSGSFTEQFAGRNAQADGINAAIAAINADGGIDGKQIEPVICDTQSTPARGPVCAQQFISAGVFGVVGFSSGWSPAGIAATDKAGILNFTYPNTTEESDNPHSYSLMGGGLNSYPAQAKYFTIEKGLTKAAILYIDLPIGDSLTKIYEEALDRYGASYTKIAVPATAADLSPYVTEAKKSGAQVIYGVIVAPQAVLAVKAAAQLGYEPEWALGDAVVEKSQLVEPLGELAEGLHGSSSTIQWFDPADDDTKVFLDAMKEYVPDAPIYQNSATGFATVQTLATALRDYGKDVTSEGFEAYLQTVTGVPVFMGGGVTLEAAAAPDAHPHDLNPAYNIVQWQDGVQVIVATGVNGWTN